MSKFIPYKSPKFLKPKCPVFEEKWEAKDLGTNHTVDLAWCLSKVTETKSFHS
jgi:uncharacterized protein YlaN (UPF0358 family)